MNIIEKTYNFRAMDKRKKTTRIILHHAAAVNCTAEQIHGWHKARGWAGIGYHFFIRKDGRIYRGRPQNTVGAHAGGANSDSVGVCFEGNYETEKMMPEAQKKAGIELVAYLKDYYKISKVQKHRDVGSTACPGKYFPFDEIAKGEVKQADPMVQITVPQIQKGSVGDAVETWQILLKAFDYNVGEHGVDGDFGDDTEKATKEFQEDNNLSVDGIVGVKSWTKMING